MRNPARREVEDEAMNRVRILANPGYNDSFVRNRELASLLSFVRNRERGVALLIGERGSGKTAVLSALSRALKDECLTVTVPAYQIGTNHQGRRNDFQAIAAAIDHELQWHVTKGTKGSARSETEGQNIFETEERIHQLLEEATERFGKVVIMLDDIDRLDPNVGTPLLLSVQPMFNIKGVFVIVASSPGILDILGGEIRAARSISDLEVYMQPLSQKEMIEMLRRPLEGSGKRIEEIFEPDALALIMAESRGIPREFQRLSVKSLERSLEEGSSRVTKSEVQGAIAEDLMVMLRLSSEKEFKLLQYIASHERVRAGDPGLERYLGVGRTRISQFLNHLTEMNLLLKKREKRFLFYQVPSVLVSSAEVSKND
jgi:type II secretory pathway predicted ATPase ExeA